LAERGMCEVGEEEEGRQKTNVFPFTFLFLAKIIFFFLAEMQHGGTRVCKIG